jgi:hypothetical protein
MSNKYAGIWALVLFMVLMDHASLGRVYAGDDSVEALRREVEALKQTVNGLEQRLLELEKRTSRPFASQVRDAGHSADAEAVKNRTQDKLAAVPSSTTAPETNIASDDGKPSVRERWRLINRQMKAEQIEALLGVPQQKFTVADKTVWYYHYPNNRRGSVTFFKDMGVAGWQIPPTGGF